MLKKTVFHVFVIALLISFCGCTGSNNKSTNFAFVNKDYSSVKVSKEERIAIRLLSKLIDGIEKQDISTLRLIYAGC